MLCGLQHCTCKFTSQIVLVSPLLDAVLSTSDVSHCEDPFMKLHARNGNHYNPSMVLNLTSKLASPPIQSLFESSSFSQGKL